METGNSHKVKVVYSTGHGKQSHTMSYNAYSEIISEYGCISAYLKMMIHEDITEISVGNVIE